MYAVLSSGGKQYRVEPGSTLTVEKLTVEAGASVTFDRVLLIADGDTVTVGTPTVAGASISATVLGEELGPKIVVFKFKQKAKYRRRTGHRQHLTRVRIDEINADGRSSRRSTAKPKADDAEAEAEPKGVAAAEKPAAETVSENSAMHPFPTQRESPANPQLEFCRQRLALSSRSSRAAFTAPPGRHASRSWSVVPQVTRRATSLPAPPSSR